MTPRDFWWYTIGALTYVIVHHLGLGYRVAQWLGFVP
jgi:hypothetical protein